MSVIFGRWFDVPDHDPSTGLRTNGLGVGRVGDWVGQGFQTPRSARGDKGGHDHPPFGGLGASFDGARGERMGWLGDD